MAVLYPARFALAALRLHPILVESTETEDRTLSVSDQAFRHLSAGAGGPPIVNRAFCIACPKASVRFAASFRVF